MADKGRGERFGGQAAQDRLRRYVIRSSWVGDELFWLARVPFGSWNRFYTWAEAGQWLTMRHEDRKIKEANRARRIESATHAHL